MKQKSRLARKITISVLSALLIVTSLICAHFIALHIQDWQWTDTQKDAIQSLEDQKGKYFENRIILADTTKKEAEALALLLDADLRMNADENYAILDLKDEMTIQSVYEDEQFKPYIGKMSPDRKIHLAELNEELGTALPTVTRPTVERNDAEYANQTYLDYLNVGEVWNHTQGNGITVAVIDTGIDTDNPDFIGRISNRSYNAATDKRVCDYDMSIIEDIQGHGTAVAAVIGANADDGIGVTGIAPGVELLIIKTDAIEDEPGVLSEGAITLAIYYAIECDVDVINMSFGITIPTNPYREELKLAYDSDIICIASAGNDSTAGITWPAADEHVIGVGALAEGSFELASYSNYGENVDMVAPGTAYTIELYEDEETHEILYRYANKQGTSFSAPMVTAAVALHMTQNFYPRFEDVEEMLQISSFDLGDLGADWYFGYGVLDIGTLIMGDVGTITFNYLSDELENTTQKFIRGKALQNVPIPEREYMVFEDWFFDIEQTDNLTWYADPFDEDLTMYAKWMNEDEDEGIPYIYVILDDGTVEIRQYTGKRRFITMPSMIEDRPVTSIARDCFAYNTRIREVVLPDTLRSIGERAFFRCTSLLHMTIPDSVEIIHEYAFGECVRLSTVATANTGALITIGDYAFSDCSSLTRFDIPANLTNLTPYAFWNASSMKTITVDAGNTTFKVVDRALCTFDGTKLIYFPAGISGLYAIPSGVKTIGDIAFIHSALASVEIGNDVEMVGASAFEKSYIYYADIGSGVREMGARVFAGSDLKVITFAENGVLAIIPVEAFSGCENLKSITLPNSVNTLGDSAFAKSGLRSIYISAGVTELGGGLFFWTPLQTVTFAEDSRLETIPESTFGKCSLLGSINLPDSVQSIGGSAFEDCISLTAIELPGSLQSIGSRAFASSGLTEIRIPASVNFIGTGAFASCHSLQNIHVADKNADFTSPNGVLYTADLKTIHSFPAGRLGSYTILNGVEIIEASCFAGALIESVSMDDSVAHIRDYAFMNADRMTSVYLSSSLQDMGICAFMSCSSLLTVDIPDAITEIPKECFMYDCSLISVELPTELVSINESAFSECSQLPTLTLPNKLKYIHKAAFSGCSSLHTIAFPQSLEEIGGYAFSDCISLGDILITKNIRLISTYAFDNCWNMQHVTFEEGSVLRRLSMGSFRNSGLVEFTVPDFINAIGQYEFSGCQNLQTITFAPNSPIEAITAYMFSGAENLHTISFGEGSALRSIQAHALEDIASLRTIDLSQCQALTNVDNYAFRYCRSLENITIPEGVTYVGRYAFMGCYALSEAKLPTTLEYLGEYAFYATDNVHVYFAADSLPAYTQNNWNAGVAGYSVGVKEVVTTDEWKYAVLNNGTISIVDYFGDATILDLSTIDGYAVTQISGNAFKDNATLTSVILPEGLIAIYNNAFKGTTALAEVTIPATVKVIENRAFEGSGIHKVQFAPDSQLQIIGQYAFAETANLTAFAVPSTVTEIRDYAFYNSHVDAVTFPSDSALTFIGEYTFAYTDLTSFEMPAAATEVGSYAFAYTPALASVKLDTANDLYLWSHAFYNAGLTGLTIPASVRYIGESCFAYCTSLQSFTVAPDSMNYASSEGALFDKNLTKLITYPGGKTGVYTVPHTVLTLGVGAFEGSSVTGVVFPENSELITIGYRTFINAKSLESMVIPDSMISIDYYAFAYCDNLKTVTIGENSQLGGIYEGAFYNCKSLTSIYIPDGVQEISNYAFFGCTALTDVTYAEGSRVKGIYKNAFAYTGLETIDIPEQVLEIGDYAYAYMVNANVRVLEIPDSVEVIGYRAFFGQTNIEELTMPGTGDTWEYFFGEKLLNLQKVTITRGEIADRMFATEWLHGTLKTVELRDGVTKIGREAFYYQDKLTSIQIPDSVTYIGDGAFWHCEKLNDIHLPNGLTSLGAYVLVQTSIRDVVLPDALVYLDMSAFWNVPLESLHINKNLCEILISGGGGNGLASSVFTTLTVDENNPFFCAIDNILYSKDKATLIYVPTGVDAQKVISDTTVEIAERAFYNNRVTKHLVLPEGITEIPNGAFYHANLASVVLPQSLQIIGDSAFYLTPLESIVIPEHVEVIGNAAFLGSHLKQVSLPDGLKSIGGSAFFSTYLEYVLIPESVTEVGDRAFGWIFSTCVMALEAEEVPAGFDETWFADPHNPDKPYYLGIKDVGEWEDFTYLANKRNQVTLIHYDGTDTEITIPSKIGDYTVTTIGNGLFAGKGELTDITLPDTITDVGMSAFADCKSLHSLIMPEGITSIGASAFAGSGLYSIEWPSSVVDIPNHAFEKCGNLERFIIPYGVVSIKDSAFYGCESLRYIVIPESVGMIGSHALDTNGVILFESDLFVPGAMFDNRKPMSFNYGFEGLMSDTAYTYALMNDNSAIVLEYHGNETSVSVPSEINGYTVAGVGAYLFKNNTTIQEVTLPQTISTISNGMFFGCSNLTAIDIPEQIVAIGERAFYNCDSLESINIPAGVDSIGDHAFYHCDRLSNIRVEGYPIYVGSYAFSSASNKTVRFASARESLPSWSDTWSMAEYDWNTYSWHEYDSKDRWGSLTTVWGTQDFETSVPEGLQFKVITTGQNAYVSVLGYTGTDVLVEIPSAIGKIPVWEIDESERFTDVPSYIYVIPVSVQSVYYSEYTPVTLYKAPNSPMYSRTPGYYGVREYGIMHDVVYCVDQTNTAHAIYLTDKTATTVYVADEFKGYAVRSVISDFLGGNFLEPDVLVETLRLPCVNASISSLFYHAIPETLTKIIIGPSCDRIAGNAFEMLPKDIEIYCYQNKNALMWDDTWNEYFDYSAPFWESAYKKYKTYYLGEWHEVAFYDINDNILDYYPLRSGQIVRLPSDYQTTVPNDGCITYTFLGWDLNGDGVSDVVPTLTGENIYAYPLYQVGSSHSYVTTVTPPTCTEQGYTTYTCHCGDSYIADYVPAKGHTDAPSVEENRIEADCTHEGSYDSVVYCSVCKVEISRETETIPATDHSYTSVVTKPTCTEQGYTTYTCHCGDRYISDYVDALGHTEVVDTYVAPTCTTDGKTEGKHCSVCNEVLVAQQTITATGHTYTAVVTKPTCTEQGYTTYTCHCGDRYIDNYVEATGHTEGEWTVIQNPDIGVEGKEQLSCSVCQEILDEREISALPPETETDEPETETDATETNLETAPETSVGVETSPETHASAPSEGCQSSITFANVTLIVLVLGAVALAFKKKYNFSC